MRSRKRMSLDDTERKCEGLGTGVAMTLRATEIMLGVPKKSDVSGGVLGSHHAKGTRRLRILLVEDDEGLGSALRDHVFAEGHILDWAHTLEDARACVEAVAYDLVLLDLMLPDGGGLTFLKRLRAEKRDVPLIILTARDRLTERIEGLNAGADDYLVKPFDLQELSARIGSVSRRYSGNPNPGLVFGSYTVDLVARSIVGPRGPVSLSQREWVIFEVLLRSPTAILTRSRLEEQLYSFDAEVESNTIEVYISRLRRKLGRGSVETIRGLGYRLGRL